MTYPRSTRRARAALAVAVMALAGCGSGSKSAPTTSVGVTTTQAAATTTSTSAASTTTSSTVAGTTTTTTPSAPTYPLTGLPADDPAKLNRPAVVIKVNNVASARPQSGINNADVIFEEKIGTAVTRLFTVYQSTDSAKVGSIRSARASDLPILAALSKPLFAWSGANQNLTPEIAKADITDAGYSRHSDLYTRGRLLPDYTEYFVSTEGIRQLTPEGQGAPKPIFAIRRPSEPAPAGKAATGVTWSKNGYVVDWVWDAAKSAWLRTQSGTPHVDADGTQVAAANVVMMMVKYKSAFDDPRSPEAVTTGTGRVWVMTNGVAVPGSWERPKDTDPFVFKDDNGNVIPLTPGRTWVELAEEDAVQPLLG